MVKMFREFLNEAKVSGREIYNNELSFGNIFAEEYKKLTSRMVEVLKENLVGKLIFFKISQENGKFRNACVRMRRISDVKPCEDRPASDSNIIFVDDKGNEMNVYNTPFSHAYYEVEPFIENLKKFIGKDVKFKRERKFQKAIDVVTSVKDILIVEDEETKHDQFAILTEKGDIELLPVFTDINTLDIKISELDPYGEEDWND